MKFTVLLCSLLLLTIHNVQCEDDNQIRIRCGGEEVIINRSPSQTQPLSVDCGGSIVEVRGAGVGASQSRAFGGRGAQSRADIYARTQQVKGKIAEHLSEIRSRQNARGQSASSSGFIGRGGGASTITGLRHRTVLPHRSTTTYKQPQPQAYRTVVIRSQPLATSTSAIRPVLQTSRPVTRQHLSGRSISRPGNHAAPPAHVAHLQRISQQQLQSVHSELSRIRNIAESANGGSTGRTVVSQQAPSGDHSSIPIHTASSGGVILNNPRVGPFTSRTRNHFISSGTDFITNLGQDDGFGDEYLDVDGFSFEAARRQADRETPGGLIGEVESSRTPVIVGSRYRKGFARQFELSKADKSGAGEGVAKIALSANRQAQQEQKAEFTQTADAEGTAVEAASYDFQRPNRGEVKYTPVRVEPARVHSGPSSSLPLGVSRSFTQ